MQNSFSIETVLKCSSLLKIETKIRIPSAALNIYSGNIAKACQAWNTV